MKTLLSSFLILFLVSSSFAQEDYIDTTKKKGAPWEYSDSIALKKERTANHLRFGVLAPGINFEYGLNNKTSITLNPYLGYGARNFIPVVMLSYNYYFTYNRRCKKNKTVKNYTGPSTGIMGLAQFSDASTKHVISDAVGGGPYIGWQYNKDVFWFSTRIGAGYAYYQQWHVWEAVPIGTFSLGFRLYSSDVKMPELKN